MYPYMFFIMFGLMFIKASYQTVILGYLVKGFFYYFAKFLFGNLYCLSVMIQAGLLDTYY